MMKTPRQALADARILVHKYRVALAAALQAESAAELDALAAEISERAPTVRPPAPAPCPGGCEKGTIYEYGGPFACGACDDGGWE
jgi:hypothetical protein